MTIETEYANKHGDRVATGDASADPVRFYPSGGGFQYSMPHEKFHEEFKPAPERTWRRGTVTAEWLPEGMALPCWTDGSLWNGWGMPAFEREQIDQLMALHAGQEGSYKLYWDGDKVLANMADSSDDREEYESFEIDGVKVWPVGAGSWCWDRAEVVNGDA